MRHPLFQLILFIAVMSFASCGDGLREEVITTYANGQPAKAFYYNKENQWVYEKDFYDNGALMMEGPIVNEMRNGDWTAYFLDGKVQSTGTFVDGENSGPHQVFHENGQLWMDGSYKDGRRCGEWILYDEQGYEERRIQYGSCD